MVLCAIRYADALRHRRDTVSVWSEHDLLHGIRCLFSRSQHSVHANASGMRVGHTISVMNFSKGCVIDLREGAFSKITIESDSSSGIERSSQLPKATYDGTNNLAIACGCVIEGAAGGSGDDTLIGNASGNTLAGNGGNDSLDGQVGIDVAGYSGARSYYLVKQGGQAVTVSNSTDGMDTSWPILNGSSLPTPSRRLMRGRQATPGKPWNSSEPMFRVIWVIFCFGVRSLRCLTRGTRCFPYRNGRLIWAWCPKAMILM